MGTNNVAIGHAVEDDRPWNGFRLTAENIGVISQLLNKVGIDIGYEGGVVNFSQPSYSYIFNNLQTNFQRLNQNYYLNNDPQLTYQINNLSIEERKLLLGYLALFQDEFFKQNVRHRHIENDTQLISHMTFMSSTSEYADQVVFKWATQILTEIQMLRDERYGLSSAPQEMLSLLYEFRPVAPFNSIPTEVEFGGTLKAYNINLLMNVLHQYVQLNRADDESIAYKPNRIMLAFKLSLLSLYLTEIGQELIANGSEQINIQFIEDFQRDMDTLFNHPEFNEVERRKFVQNLIEDMDKMNENRGRETLIDTITLLCGCDQSLNTESLETLNLIASSL